MEVYNVYSGSMSSEGELAESRFRFIIHSGVPGQYIEACKDFLEGLEEIRKPEGNDLKEFVLRQMRGYRKPVEKVSPLDWFHNKFGARRKVVIKIKRRAA